MTAIDEANRLPAELQAEPPADEPGPRTFRRRAVSFGLKLLYVAGLLVGWELIVHFAEIRRYLLPPPSAVAAKVVESFGILMEHAWITTSEALAGLALAGITGILLAVLIVLSPAVRGVAMPTLVAFNAIPKVAFAPLLIIWIGIGFESKVAMAFLIAFFPIVVNTTTGMSDVEPELLNLLRLNHASQRQMFIKIRLPHALPAMFDGFKIALPLAIIGALVGEFVAASEGLGYLIVVGGIQLNTELVFACVALIAAISVALYELLVFVEHRTLRWRPSAR
jgi:NitT/TauT family transport system permease protein